MTSIRTDLFQKVGLKEPTNVDELIEAARVLTVGENYGIGAGIGLNRATTNVFFKLVNTTLASPQ